MPRHLRMIETEDAAHLRWSHSFRQRQSLITAYHFPDRTSDEMLHDHDFMEIQLCAGGRGWQRSAHDDTPFTRGGVLLIRPGAWHYHHDNENVDAYVCCFASDLLRHELLWTLDDPRLNQLLWRSTPDGDGVLALRLDEPVLRTCIGHLDALAALGENEAADDMPARIGHLILILSCLCRAIVPDPAGPAAFPPVHHAVKRSLSLLEENLAETWTAADLARRLNIDLSYLGRLFQQALGISPMAYLAQARSKRAAQLLLRTDKPISQVGAEVGWPDPNHFARRFRAHFGLSATEYRERFLRHQSTADVASS